MRFTRLLALIVGLSASSLHARTVIDFDSIVPGGNGNGDVGPALDLAGYRFSSTHYHTLSNFAVLNGLTQNGSPVYIGSEGGANGSIGSTLTLQRVDGKPFVLLKFDLSECTINEASYPTATFLRINVDHAGGSVSSHTFPIDGVADGAGGVADFETVIPLIANAVRLTFDGLSASGGIGFAYALDNVDVVENCGIEYGVGCPGSGGFVPSVEIVGCPGENDVVGLTLQDALGGQPAYLAFGLQQGAGPLGFGCFLNVQPVFPFLLPISLGGTGPGNGHAMLLGTMPPGTSGISFTMQCFAADSGSPLGYSASRGYQYLVP